MQLFQKVHGVDITHHNVCYSMLSCFFLIVAATQMRKPNFKVLSTCLLLKNAVYFQIYVSWPFPVDTSCIWPQMRPWSSLSRHCQKVATLFQLLIFLFQTIVCISGYSCKLHLVSFLHVSECSAHCAERSCDFTSGHCVMCKTGYDGDTCGQGKYGNSMHEPLYRGYY